MPSDQLQLCRGTFDYSFLKYSFDRNARPAMIIHFPIALFMAGFLSEVIGRFSKNKFYTNAAFYLLLLGALGAVTAYISGSYAGEGMGPAFLIPHGITRRRLLL